MTLIKNIPNLLNRILIQMEEKKWYFAYGSNMNRARCEGRLNSEGAEILDECLVKLDKHKLTFNKKNLSGKNLGFANVVPDENDHV